MSGRQERGTGRRRPVFSDRAILLSVRELQPTTSRRLAGALGCSASYARARLDRLNEAGLVDRRHQHEGRRGHPAWIYWLASEPQFGGES
jgi:predicted ArsR family transcriptional regulator